VSGFERARLVGLLLCAAAPRGEAQLVAVASVTGTYRIAGTVAEQSGTPVPAAEVTVIERDTVRRIVRTDDKGKFLVDGLLRPDFQLRVRRVGFQAKRIDVRIASPDRPASVFVKLEPMATTLGTVRIDDESDDAIAMDARLRGFYDRSQSNNFGRYIDEAALLKLHSQFISEALRRVPGVTIKPSRRIGNVVRLRNCGVNLESNEHIGPLIWVDGVRMPGAELDEVAQANDVAAVEIYNSYAGIPAQYFDRSATCGTILVWTKGR
jgi:hypothetical protein